MGTRFKDTLLLVGDASSDRASLRRIFESKYYLLEAENAAQGILLLRQNAVYIAAVLADILLDKGDDLSALVAACQPDAEHMIPVISVITPAGTGENEEYALVLGAAGVVRKPYTTLSIQRHVQVLVELYKHQWDLERMVREQSFAIHRNYQIMLDTLSSLIEYRSSESGNHVLRIRRFTKLLLEEVARSCPEYGLTRQTIDLITSASALHDVGKISIPDSILGKPGKLTPEEFEIIKSHTTVGGQLVERMKDMGEIGFLRYIYNIALYHHERWDGGGYPEGLMGDQIPICAQVVGLTDAFDALITQRVYKPALPYDTAVNMIVNGECGAFSPKLLECFKRVRNQMIELAKRYADGYSPKSDDIRIPLPGPEVQTYTLNAMQMAQMKYQSMLHYLNDTVIEMDLDHRVYHVVYNPNPDFASLFNNVSFDDISKRIIRDSVHPEDALQVRKSYAEGMLRLLRQGSHTYRFQCRMFSPPSGMYRPYEITLQRIITENDEQHMVFVVFHAQDKYSEAPVVQHAKSLLESPVLFDLTNATLCCMMDETLTICEGASTLTALTGYSLEDIWDRFHNSLLQMANPVDRPRIREIMHSQNIRSGRVEFDFRLRRKGAAPVWVQCRSRCYVGPDGTEYFYQTLSDITRLKQAEFEKAAALRRNELLLDQSRSVVFEWDLKTDVMSCSGRWQERFGYPVQQQGFSRRLEEANHIHPDDLPLLRAKYQGMCRGTETDVIDLRIANNEGRYLWSRIRATAIQGLAGKPSHIIGIVYDIDELKTDALSMQQQAQYDDLTRLMNKASTQRVITDYLSSRKKDTMDALLILDLDNFKTINDTLGHLYGDAVLKQVGATLHNLFRAQDAVGRIGGDEFMILLKDVPNLDIIQARCDLLVDTLRAQLKKLTPNLNVSVSVGVAVAPRDGNTYADLFRHADEALYIAKRRGKNQYSIYSLLDKIDAIAEPGANMTRIDSDFRNSLSDDNLLWFVFQSLFESRNLETTIRELLAFIGIHFNVSRVYIFENNEDNTACNNTFEWCSPGVEPQIDVLQNISYETDIPDWPQVYDENGILYCTDVSQLSPTARAVVEPQGIRSMLQCTILDQGQFRGFIGFDECTANYLWTQGQVSQLKLLSAIFSVFVTKLRGEQR